MGTEKIAALDFIRDNTISVLQEVKCHKNGTEVVHHADIELLVFQLDFIQIREFGHDFRLEFSHNFIWDLVMISSGILSDFTWDLVMIFISNSVTII